MRDHQTDQIEGCTHHRVIILELQAKIVLLENQLINVNRDLHAARGIDQMTHLINKSRFLEVLTHHVAISKRDHEDAARNNRLQRENTTVAFIDLDEFKKHNDGRHLRGDRLIKEFAMVLQAVTREVDIVARFGGDEFAIIAPNTDADQANTLCEKIRQEIIKYEFDSQNEPTQLVASIGLASTSEGILDVDKLIDLADRRMHIEKSNKKQAKKIRLIA